MLKDEMSSYINCTLEPDRELFRRHLAHRLWTCEDTVGKMRAKDILRLALTRVTRFTSTDETLVALISRVV